MIPYADFFSLGVALYVTFVAAMAGLLDWLRQTRLWVVVATAVMLVLTFSGSQVLWHGAKGQVVTVPTLAFVLAYAFFQYIVARAWLAVRIRGKRQWAYCTVIGLALAPLVVAKLGNHLAPSDVLGFLGISYLTFRCVDTVIGIQDGLITDLPLVQYLAFLLFFPTLSAGPIDRYRRFEQDWTGNPTASAQRGSGQTATAIPLVSPAAGTGRSRTRAEWLNDLDGALQRLFRGLLYKFILASLIRQYWLNPAAHMPGLLGTLSYMYAYSFYLFFDFAGYSAFAIAFSYVLGIHTPENFNRPFLARDIRDFWNRWHITLSYWFRDHIYMRFVLAATRGKWFKDRHLASYGGFLLSMGLMGAWHGLTWYYLIYGLYQAALLIGHDVFSRWNKQHHVLHGPAWTAASIALTFNAVCFGLLLFSGHLA